MKAGNLAFPAHGALTGRAGRSMLSAMAAGPAWKTASELADGYLSLNQANLKRFEKHELEALQKELEKLSREVRSTVVPDSDNEAAQSRNRKLLRLSQATIVLQSYRSRMGR